MISCKKYVEEQKRLLKERVSTYKKKPKLCVMQIGEDAASNTYVKNKKRSCEELDIEFEHIHITDCDKTSQE